MNVFSHKRNAFPFVIYLQNFSNFPPHLRASSSAETQLTPNWTRGSRPSVHYSLCFGRILYRQDKQLPFMSGEAYYMMLYNFLLAACPLMQPAELRIENAKPSLYWRERARLCGLLLFLYFFILLPPKLRQKEGISKQQQEIRLYI